MKKALQGAFLIVGVMHGFVVCVFYFSKASVKILLDAASAVFSQDMCAFAYRLMVQCTVLIFYDLQGNPLLSFIPILWREKIFIRLLARFVLYIFLLERQR